MNLCVEHSFDILLTIDKNLQFQQNLNKYPIAIVIFDSRSADISDLSNLIQPFLSQIESFEKYKAYTVKK